MNNQTEANEQVGHSVFNAIAGWVNRYREAISARAEFANCGTDEVANIARDVAVSPEELLYISNKGPHAADELPSSRSAEASLGGPWANAKFGARVHYLRT
jgi:hypothetical protein